MTLITPKYKLIMTYDILARSQSEYMQFVLGEFVPALQEMGLYMMGVYHTAIGDYPARHVEFVSESWSTMEQTLNGTKFNELEERFKEYVVNYTRKVVPYRRGFQF